MCFDGPGERPARPGLGEDGEMRGDGAVTEDLRTVSSG